MRAIVKLMHKEVYSADALAYKNYIESEAYRGFTEETTPMRQAFAFSLYGSDLRYSVGAIKNAIIAQQILEHDGYELVFFVGASVPPWVISTLNLFSNVRIIQTDAPEDHTAKLWRFLACELDYDFVAFRDADARLSLREFNAHEAVS
jgi:hypothetical protein